MCQRSHRYATAFHGRSDTDALDLHFAGCVIVTVGTSAHSLLRGMGLTGPSDLRRSGSRLDHPSSVHPTYSVSTKARTLSAHHIQGDALAEG